MLQGYLHEKSSTFIFDYNYFCLRGPGHHFGSLRLAILSPGKPCNWEWKWERNITISDIFSSPEPKAHRWAYSIPMLRRPSVRRRPSYTISNFFFSETAWPIIAKFYVEPPWVGVTKVCSWHLSHMTKMAATPIYGKNPSKIFFRTGRPIFMKLGM